MPALYRIDTHEWHLWRGPPPGFAQEQAEHYVRPGLDGVGILQLGAWAGPFEIEVEAHFGLYAAALRQSWRVHQLGRGLVKVIYEGIDYEAAFNHKYSVDQVALVECRRVPRLLGPTYDLVGGTRLVMRLTLTPHSV